jgi:hypothetical protein
MIVAPKATYHYRHSHMPKGGTHICVGVGRKCLPLPHSTTPSHPIRRIARPPTPQLSSRFDSRATHARLLLPEALASVPLGLYKLEYEFEFKNQGFRVQVDRNLRGYHRRPSLLDEIQTKSPGDFGSWSSGSILCLVSQHPVPSGL